MLAQIAQVFTSDLRLVLILEGVMLAIFFAWAWRALLDDLLTDGAYRELFR